MPWWIWPLGIVILVLGCLFLYWQDSDLTLSRYTVRLSSLPSAFSGFRIVQLSDLHNKRFGKKQERLLKKVRELAPDCIVLTGDLADKRRTKDERYLPAKELADGLVSIAPVYAVMGNHETERGRVESMTAMLTACGVTVLHNEHAVLTRGGNTLTLLGAADIAESWAVFPESEEQGSALHQKELTALCKKAEGCSILLSHRPHLTEMYRTAGAPLVLSGHAHGGQVRLPVIGGLYAPQQGLFPKYTAGVHDLGGVQLVVSRGLGNSRFPFRVFNRPEIVSVELKKF